MGWREWLGLKVTPEKFAALMIGRARSLGLGEFEYDADMRELRQSGAKTKWQLYLGRVYEEYVRAPSSDRPKVIDNFLSALSNGNEDVIPSSYELARPNLLPILRDSVDVAVAELAVRRASAIDGSEFKSSAMSGGLLVGTLMQGLAFDTPHAINRIAASQLETWGVSFETAMSDAIDNLRLLNHPNGWTQLDAHTWSGHWGDAYASSRMVTPEVIHQLGVPEPIVMVPTPDTLLVASGRSENALASLAYWCEQSGGPEKRALSSVAYRLNDRNWSAIPKAEQNTPELRNFQLKGISSAHEEQKQLLDDIHSRTDQDIWVASYQLMKKEDSDLITAYTVWTESVDSLLPLADHLVVQSMSDDGNEVAKRVIVPMESALPILLPHLEVRKDLVPVRYRTTGFPTPSDWVQLELMAIQL